MICSNSSAANKLGTSPEFNMLLISSRNSSITIYTVRGGEEGGGGREEGGGGRGKGKGGGGRGRGESERAKGKL